MNNIELAKDLLGMMDTKQKREFYMACRQKKFQDYLDELGLSVMIDMLLGKNSDVPIDPSVKGRYIEKIFNNKNMLSQKYIKYSFTVRMYFLS